MSNQKRSRHKISLDEINAERFLNKIPSALLELQRRGFLLPRKEQLEVDQLFEASKSEAEEQQQENLFGGNVLNVFEQHEQKLSNALTGIYKTSIKNSSSSSLQNNSTPDNEINSQSVSSVGGINSQSTSSINGINSGGVSSVFNEKTWNRLGRKEEEFTRDSPMSSPIRIFNEPNNMLSLLSNGKGDKILGENGAMNFQFPEFKSQQPAKAKIEIGKLIEQVNIHAQDVSGGSQQLVKMLKEKLVEILKDELDTGY